ncbi:protein-disulfide reductase DsbD domain-containing protein [Mucilaginibacter sp.]|jgi:DsbC/DsbD-like thiol-disulfide interchange protein|uniref:protein-disulfide reductase DsbD domain-containing protein n=1 Tax=Mucilaginibacter sp. TaxID=1882438 RepID=UPI003561379F
MKKILFALFILGAALSANGQIYKPIKWSYMVKKLLDTAGYEVHLKADIQHGWHLYAQSQPPGAIAKPTQIIFKKDEDLVLIGKIREKGKQRNSFNSSLGVSANQYEGMVDFVQVIKVKDNLKTISGTITFQTCTDKMCLPSETVPFTVPLR